MSAKNNNLSAEQKTMKLLLECSPDDILILLLPQFLKRKEEQERELITKLAQVQERIQKLEAQRADILSRQSSELENILV